MHPQKDTLTEDVRETILSAAEKRFRIYGYNKTTMAEIAKDCNMSAANLYRYFDNKLDIVVTLASSRLAHKEWILTQIVADESKPASARLRNYIFETLYQTYKQSAETPRINEMIHAVCEERMDLVNEHMNNKIQILTSLVASGIDSGEFSAGNPQQTAESILTAITLFDMYMLSPLFVLEIMEKKAEGLTNLILNGLLNKQLCNPKNS